MFAALGAHLAGSALMMSPIGGFLKRFWKPLLIVLVLVAALIWHGHKVKAFGKRQYDAGWVAHAKKTEAAAHALEQRAKALSDKARSLNNAENLRIRRGADALRLRGPGKAACRPDFLSAGAGGHVAASGQGAGAPAGLSGEDRFVGLPFGWTVDNFERCDLLRAEVLTWRSWHKAQSEEAERAKAVNR